MFWTETGPLELIGYMSTIYKTHHYAFGQPWITYRLLESEYSHQHFFINHPNRVPFPLDVWSSSKLIKVTGRMIFCTFNLHFLKYGMERRNFLNWTVTNISWHESPLNASCKELYWNKQFNSNYVKFLLQGRPYSALLNFDTPCYKYFISNWTNSQIC
jgi:hypothetical protein